MQVTASNRSCLWDLSRGWLVPVGLAVLGACSPALNWREVRADGTPVQMLLPCKPERAIRAVPLLGLDVPPLDLHMLSCETGGATYAVAAARLPDDSPPTADRAVQAWRLAAWASLKQAPAAPGGAPLGWEQAVGPAGPGAPLSRIQGWQGPGVAHDGQPLHARLWWGRQGPWLLQAAAYAPRAAAGQDEAWTTLTDSLRIQP
jgi:hypothetical protein